MSTPNVSASLDIPNILQQTRDKQQQAPGVKGKETSEGKWESEDWLCTDSELRMIWGTTGAASKRKGVLKKPLLRRLAEAKKKQFFIIFK